MAFYRSLSVYLSVGPRAEVEARVEVGVGAGAGVGSQETADVLFFSVGAPASSSLPPRGGLQLIRGLTIWLARWSSKIFVKLLFFQTSWLICWIWSF